MSMKKRLMSACAGVLAVGALGSIASAKLTIDLRQAETGAKQIELTAADLNKPITLDVYAKVEATAGKIQTFKAIQGAFVSAGTVKGEFTPAGDLDPVNFATTFVGLGDFCGMGTTLGKSQDIDGDGDMDLGGKPGEALADWVVIRTDIGGYGTKATHGQASNIANGKEFLVGRLTFTPTAMGNADTWINFLPRVDATGAYMDDTALWTEDGAAGASLRNGTTGEIALSGFQIIVPEPATMSVLGLGGALLLGRRNRK